MTDFYGDDEDRLRGAKGAAVQAVTLIDGMVGMGHCSCSESHRKDVINLLKGAVVMLDWLVVVDGDEG